VHIIKLELGGFHVKLDVEGGFGQLLIIGFYFPYELVCLHGLSALTCRDIMLESIIFSNFVEVIAQILLFKLANRATSHPDIV
jgi:hypothetical protein